MFDFECLMLAHVCIAQTQLDKALRLLARLEPVIQAGSRKGSLIKLLSLRALTLRALALSSESWDALERALTLAEPEGYIRSFVDEGEPMRLLLLDYQAMIKKRIGDKVENVPLRLLIYTDKLLAAFSQPAIPKQAKAGLLAEPLSERELDILRLIATGRSNQEIAEILVIAVSTVKSHINNLYGKLGTNRRTEAIAMAHELGLLSE
jgi:LuxR family maltose regulon positive regulatory protein